MRLLILSLVVSVSAWADFGLPGLPDSYPYKSNDQQSLENALSTAYWAVRQTGAVLTAVHRFPSYLTQFEKMEKQGLLFDEPSAKEILIVFAEFYALNTRIRSKFDRGHRGFPGFYEAFRRQIEIEAKNGETAYGALVLEYAECIGVPLKEVGEYFAFGVLYPSGGYDSIYFIERKNVETLHQLWNSRLLQVIVDLIALGPTESAAIALSAKNIPCVAAVGLASFFRSEQPKLPTIPN
jgi:hypothetical protein